MREPSFLGALGVLMQREGHTRETVCGLFTSHAGDGFCPSYISDLFAPPLVLDTLVMTQLR